MNQGPLCGCGCGERITIQPHHKYAGVPRFRYGHYARTEAHKAERAASAIKFDPPNPSGLCRCGCGEKTPVAKITSVKRGQLKGHPIRFVPHHHVRVQPKGKDSPRWKGGRVMRRGYVFLHMPDHPRADSKGYVPEHQFVVEQTRGRPLERGEIVHHINGVPDDNRPENLIVMTNRAHLKLHQPERNAGIRESHRADPSKRREAGRKGAAKRWGKA